MYNGLFRPLTGFSGGKKMAAFLVLLSAMLMLSGVYGDLEPLVQRCCSSGELWARGHTSCDGAGASSVRGAGGERASCLAALRICCARAHAKAHCEEGKRHARTHAACRRGGGGTFEDCCEACQLGLQSAALRTPCSFSRFAFGAPWDEAFVDCCTNPGPEQEQGTSPQPTAGGVAGGGRCDPRTNPCSQKCEEIGHAVRCSCYPGYTLSSDLHTCEDMNECALGTNTCNPATETCQNIVGGFQCLEKPSTNRPTVQCPPGYVFNADKRTCDDVDECAVSGACAAGLTCVNSKGSFSCRNSSSVTACPRGFVFYTPTGRCIDVDECSERIDDCDRALQICQNSHGSFRCVGRPPSRSRGDCPAGFKWSDGKSDCEDVDECGERLDGCSARDHRCRNTVGGYECDPKCPAGKHFDPRADKCVEADQCSRGLHSCKADEVCLPDSAGFKCVAKSVGQVCSPGFKPDVAPDGVTGICIDVDECSEFGDVCDLTEQCVNEEGSYDCLPADQQQLPQQRTESCPAGFEFGYTGCTDVDECALRVDNCDRGTQDCVNTNGSYECGARGRQCPPGYRPRDGGCEDVDECVEGRHKCLEGREQCQNVPGAYRCRQLTPARTCPQGRRFDPGTGSCEDVNECEEGSHACDPITHTCVNAVGSYRCVSRASCPHGYRWNEQRSKCDDVNECSEGVDDCDRRREVCVNTVGSYQCQSRQPPAPHTNCGTGFVYDPAQDNCRDVDECGELRPCRPDQTCENTPGSFRCVCLLGYTMDAFTGECRDVNECQLQLHSCEASQRCDNTLGSYACVRTTSCGTGYTLNAATSTCEDDDECVLGSHNCGAGFACRNLQGSFRCDRVRCPRGQRLLSDGTCKVVPCPPGTEHDDQANCVDINECALNPPACRQNQRCVNSPGSFRCVNLLSCGPGYELNEPGDACVDVDECERRLSDCGAGQTCRNRQGGYTCECPKGYTLSGQRVCEDVDECQRFRGQVCASNSECINTQGSYTCNCNDGFRASDADKSCQDIDECAETPGICQQTCNNVWGSYQCSCHPGYTLADDDRTCQDIDECEVYGGIGSLCIGFCVNEPGSFKCACPEGYRLSSDGRTCQDIDECQEGNICGDASAVCLNTRGGHRCNRIDCPPNYVRDKEHRNRCKRSARDCHQRAGASADDSCLRDPLSYSYNYITFVSNMRLPLSGQLDLFTMRGPRFQSTSVNFELELVDARWGDSRRVTRNAARWSHGHLPTNVTTRGSDNRRAVKDDEGFSSTRGGDDQRATTLSDEPATARGSDGRRATTRGSDGLATRGHFHLRRTHYNEAMVALVKTLKGPQDVELDLVMKIYHNGLFGGKAVAKIYIFVTEHEF